MSHEPPLPAAAVSPYPIHPEPHAPAAAPAPDAKAAQDPAKPRSSKWIAAAGVGVGIGSAAIVAALLYAIAPRGEGSWRTTGRRRRSKPPPG